MRSQFCPVRQYNKDKPDKFRVDFFLLAASQHYFIYHLDVYQGKNKANIDIDPSVANLPTTQKAVANAILKSDIANDPHGCRFLYMDNRYAAPQLFAMMATNWNVRAVGTCKANRKGFASDALVLDKKAPRGSYVRLADDRLGMVITRWRDSKTLQTVSTVMVPGHQTVNRRIGRNIIEVTCPNDIVMYQKSMDGVDRGDQHRVMGAGFSNVAHFKKWYKKSLLGLADFSLLNAFVAWNLSAEKLKAASRGGGGGGGNHIRRVLKWEFCAAAAEEMMSYVDNEEATIATSLAPNQPGVHLPKPVIKGQIAKYPQCMVCSLEECIVRKAEQARNKKGC